MKKISIILSFILMVFVVAAQQNATTATTQKATPTMKVDSKPSTINAPVTNNGEAKACCAGKTQAQCSHDSKACTKGEANKAACCQKGSTQSCSHGSTEKASDKKSQ